MDQNTEKQVDKVFAEIQKRDRKGSWWFIVLEFVLAVASVIIFWWVSHR